MNEVNTVVQSLLQASPPLLMAFALNVFIWLFRQIPLPDRIIRSTPLLACFLGAVLYPCLSPGAGVSLTSTSVLGFCIGGLAVAFHQQFKQWFHLKTGNTEFYAKPRPQASSTSSTAAMLIACVGTAFLLVACASLETNAYRVVGSTAVSVDLAMQGWGDWVRQGKATPEDEARVRAVYEKYQASMRAANRAVLAYHNNKNKAELERALDTATVGASNVAHTARQIQER